MDVNALTATSIAMLVAVAWKLAGAIVLWLVGRWLIRFASRLLGRALVRQDVDATLSRYFQTGLGLVLNVALVVAILGFFGVETTTFAALVAAGGVAIGVAWGGLLANFAAGAFLVFLRPFKVGDFVSAAGVVGTVDSIGLFGTTINTPDNVLTIVGNNKIFSETIQNFSANPYRRVDLTATISNAVDHHQAIGILQERLRKIPNVLADPAPTVDVLQFTRMVREAFGEAGFPAPAPAYVVSGATGLS
jgi:small conductance mechanosensitive channel